VICTPGRFRVPTWRDQVMSRKIIETSTFCEPHHHLFAPSPCPHFCDDNTLPGPMLISSSHTQIISCCTTPLEHGCQTIFPIVLTSSCLLGGCVDKQHSTGRTTGKSLLQMLTPLFRFKPTQRALQMSRRRPVPCRNVNLINSTNFDISWTWRENKFKPSRLSMCGSAKRRRPR